MSFTIHHVDLPPALVLVYDYHAGADTLIHKHFHLYNQKPSPLSESLIWQYIIQLSSALRTVHHNGLAVRCIDLSKVLVLGSNRYWINPHTCMYVHAQGQY